jgi:hypothetical protein
MRNIFFIFPNIPGFLPIGGDLKNIWMIFLVTKNISRIRFSTIYIIGVLSFLFLLSSINSFSLKYVLIAFMPFLVKFFLTRNYSIEKYILSAAYICILLSPLAVFQISSLDAIFELFFGTGSGFSGSTGRGVAYYANEPSHMSLYLLLFLSLAPRVSFQRQIILFLSSALIIAFASSGSLFLYLVFYMFLFGVFKLWNLRLRSLLFLIPLIFFLYYAVTAGYFPQRIYGILSSLSDLISNLDNFTIESTARLASGRFIANYLWLTDLQNHPFGQGFGLDRSDIVDWGLELGISFQSIGAFHVRGLEGLPIMPRSYVVSIFSIFGIFGVLFLLIVFFVFLHDKKITNYPMFGTAIFYLLVVGLPGNPLPWLIINLCLVGKLKA